MNKETVIRLYAWAVVKALIADGLKPEEAVEKASENTESQLILSGYNGFEITAKSAQAFGQIVGQETVKAINKVAPNYEDLTKESRKEIREILVAIQSEISPMLDIFERYLNGDPIEIKIILVPIAPAPTYNPESVTASLLDQLAGN